MKPGKREVEADGKKVGVTRALEGRLPSYYAIARRAELLMRQVLGAQTKSEIADLERSWDSSKRIVPEAASSRAQD